MSKIKESSEIVHVIVPLWNRAEHIKNFVNNLQQIVNTTRELCMKLWIVDFKSTDIVLSDYTMKLDYPIEIITLDPPFIIGKGLQIAAETVYSRQPNNTNAILYFCDADTVLPNGIFDRIRGSVVKSKTFYAPIVSRENSHGFVEPSVNKGGKGNIGVNLIDFIRSKGWRYPKHAGNVFRNSPGPMTKTSWGGHDTHIYEVLTKVSRLTPIRKPEPDQWVKYHERDTDGWFNEFMQKGGEGHIRVRRLK